MSQEPLVLPARIEVPDAPGLEVRTWRRSDAPALAAAIESSLDHLRPWMPWIAAEPLSLQERVELITAWEVKRLEGADAVYGILRDGRVLGGTGAHRRIGPGGLEIGYWLRADEEGRGTMTAVVTALTQVLLDQPGISRVEIRNDETNLRSAAVPRRCGYRLVGTVARSPQAPAETGVMHVWRVGSDPVEAA